MHKNPSLISFTTLRFLISSWKHIPSIMALHHQEVMLHFLREHPFTEEIQHRNNRGFDVTLTSPRL